MAKFLISRHAPPDMFDMVRARFSASLRRGGAARR